MFCSACDLLRMQFGPLAISCEPRCISGTRLNWRSVEDDIGSLLQHIGWQVGSRISRRRNRNLYL